MKRSFLVLVVVLTLFAVPMMQIEVLAKESAYTAYESERFSFSLSYPSTWEIHEGLFGTALIALAPLEAKDSLFRATVNVAVGELGGLRPTLDDYYTLSLAELESVIEGFQLIVGSDGKLADVDAKTIIFTGTQDSLELTWLQSFILVDGAAYVLTYTVETEKFISYLPFAISIFNSFAVQ